MDSQRWYQHPPGYHQGLPAIFFTVVTLIVYGSLYPWFFRIPPGPVDPIGALLRSWSVVAVFDRRYLADVIINLVLYVPLGMSGYLAFHKVRNQALRIGGLVLFGFVLSASIEMLQLLVPGRRCGAIDLLNNTIGTAGGVIAATLFEAVVGRKWMDGHSRRAVDRSALALLLIWVGSLLFPLFPVMWLAVFRGKLVSISQAPLFEFGTFVAALASWYAAGLMLRSVVSDRFWLWASVALIPAQFFIMSRVPSLSALVGAIAGVVLFVTLKRRPVGWIFLALMVLRGLSPFRVGAPHSFSLVPFGGFLSMDWQTGIRVLLEKFWNMGAAVWIFRAERMPLDRAIVIVTVVAALIEVGQMFLPGRTAEITDPMLVVLAGLAIRALGRPAAVTGPRARVS